MSLKPRPNHSRYLQTFRSMTPAERLAKAFERSAFTKQLFLAGLRHRIPERSDAELRGLALERLCARREGRPPSP